MLLSVAEGLTGTVRMQDKEKQIYDLTAKLRDKNLPVKVRDKLKLKIHVLKAELNLTPPVSSSDQDVNRCKDTNGAGENADSAECDLSGELVDRWPHFKETYMVSSLRGDGMESLKVPPTHS